MPEAAQSNQLPQVTNSVPISHDRKKIGLTVLIILVVAGLIITAYWFLFLNKASDDSDLTGPVPKVTTNTSTDSATNTTNWKTYSNSQLGVSLKLPNEFPHHQELTSELNGPVTRVNFSDNKDFRSTDPKRTTISVSTCKKCPNYVIYNYVSKLEINKTSTNTSALTKWVHKSTRLENVTIDGLVALKELTIGEQNKENKYSYEVTVYVKKEGDDYYSIEVRSETKENYDKNIKTFDLIISTIEFLD